MKLQTKADIVSKILNEYMMFIEINSETNIEDILNGQSYFAKSHYELFETEKAVSKFKLDSTELSNKISIQCKGLKPWRMETFGYSKYPRRIIAKGMCEADEEENIEF